MLNRLRKEAGRDSSQRQTDRRAEHEQRSEDSPRRTASIAGHRQSEAKYEKADEGIQRNFSGQDAFDKSVSAADRARSDESDDADERADNRTDHSRGQVP